MKLNKTQTRLQELGLDFRVYVDKFEGQSDDEIIIETCGKCGGKGIVFYYLHVDGGICYDCNGMGHWKNTVATLRKRHRGYVNRDNLSVLKSAIKRAETEAKINEFNEENPGLSEKITALANGGNSFAVSLEDALNKFGSLTENQVNAVNKMINQFEREATEKSLATPVPTGKDVVTGTILSMKWVDNHFSYNGGTLKMVVQDDRGFKVYGTVPKAITTDENGDYSSNIEDSRVTFNATLEPSKDDDKFGFFKRPTKARLI